jgi:hypothetical protein
LAEGVELGSKQVMRQKGGLAPGPVMNLLVDLVVVLIWILDGQSGADLEISSKVEPSGSFGIRQLVMSEVILGTRVEQSVAVELILV